MTPRVVREKNMAMSPAGPETKNVCAGEGQQQHIRTEHIKYKAKLIVSLHNVTFMQDICTCAVNKR
jgi:hypothetical protein